MQHFTWRELRRTEDEFALTPAASRKYSLCEGCPNQSCKARGQLKSCSEFIVTLVFRDKTGIGRHRFNTVRLGSRCARTLFPGEIVGLSDGVEVFGYARIEECLIVPNTIAGLSEVAQENHLCVGDNLTPEQAAERLAGVLKRCYGPMIVDNHDALSVLYLKQVK